jgi:hypothetical protein
MIKQDTKLISLQLNSELDPVSLRKVENIMRLDHLAGVPNATRGRHILHGRSYDESLA